MKTSRCSSSRCRIIRPTSPDGSRACTPPSLRRRSPRGKLPFAACREEDRSIVLVLELAAQDLPLAGMIGWADNPLLLHALHDGRRPVVADLQPALDIGCRRLSVPQDDAHG